MAQQPSSIYDFYRTAAGKNFFGVNFPAFIQQMERIADALETQNDLKERELKESKQQFIKEQYNKKKYFEKIKPINED